MKEKLITMQRATMAAAALAVILASTACRATAASMSNGEIEKAMKAAKQMKPIPPPDVPGAIVLFSGKASELASNWEIVGTDKPAPWKIEGDAMTVAGANIQTRAKFKDCQLHVEFRTPFMPDAHGQGRGNSGIGLQQRYEIQVLDSFGLDSVGKGDCGAVYNVSAPLINMARPPRVWQFYDIFFRAPRFDADGKQTESARVTVLWNGVLVQNNVEIPVGTGIGPSEPTRDPAQIILQDHGTPVQYRNIWIVPVPEHGAERY
ncbi:MAG: DUF1080 domain-containing protein [Armatimonadetes bacterium]|nr:DUF1080 domain-containing protein [Armatimonadota bacterium]